jgi:hypothetical protein
MIEFLKGKKTYIAAVALMIYGIAIGDMQPVLEGFGLIGLRAAITK